jgi:hypothetical protein
MVISRLCGGIGNQMFQYATGRALSVRLGSKLKLDRSWFKDMTGCTPRSYALGDFRLEAEPAAERELTRPRMRRGRAFLHRLEVMSGLSARRVEEPHFEYWRGFEELAGDVHLVGYWQSEKYFAGIRGTLLRELSVARDAEGKNRDVAEQIAAADSVAVHVRRGDYATVAKTNAFHGVLGLAYYDRAFQHVASRVRSPKLFVFSDDPSWARDNLRTALPAVFVAHNGADAGHEDLRLMSLCKHHIIANSSFSWWGAWLSGDGAKIVIAPRRWFENEEMDRQTGDLIPEGWVRL